MENKIINPKVCFFDSGIGGLNLLYESVRKLPRVDFVYFADNFNMPYGSLPHDKLLNLADAVFGKIEKLCPSAAVIACNTVTAQCADYLRAKYKFEIVGIQPAIKPAAAGGGRCLVLATPSTVQSGAFGNLTSKYGGMKTQVSACPDLAPYIEQNIFNISYGEVAARLPDVKTDAVVLGCTHYVFVKKIIADFYSCPVFDGIEGTANRLCAVIDNTESCSGRAQRVTFEGGDAEKNRRVFNMLMREKGNLSQKN